MLTGRVWKYGDHVNTDPDHPGGILTITTWPIWQLMPWRISTRPLPAR